MVGSILIFVGVGLGVRIALSATPAHGAEASTQPAASQPAGESRPPKAGEKAAEFTLKSIDGRAVTLSKLTAEGPVVLVVLRGWPGYQCPLCTRQVGELVGKAAEFKAAKAKVLLVYPGPAERLGEHAKEFAAGKGLPDDFTLATDPDYRLVNAYRLGWAAASETAYPSTFVIDPGGVIRFAKVSKSHGDRAATGDVLKALTELKKAE
ncbi:MAG: redoxin domain-containing protein [Planctomycetota bacterium]|nr:redoxin domain-containing protein [Planctomycetota bacterium]